MRDFVRRFAVAGGYSAATSRPSSCTSVARRTSPRRSSRSPAEIDRTFHRGGVHKRMWNTGSTYNIALEPALSQQDAANYAVRFYLAGLHIRYERMYFYNWGSPTVPIVLQAEGGAPTESALFVEELERWLAGARIRSCASSTRGRLPRNVWQCELAVTSGDARGERAVIRWIVDGEVVMSAEPGAYRLQRLDGTIEPLQAGEGVRLREQPVLIRYRISRQ